MTKPPLFTIEHKDLIVDALRNVQQVKWSCGIKLDQNELRMIQECILIVDNWQINDY